MGFTAAQTSKVEQSLRTINTRDKLRLCLCVCVCAYGKNSAPGAEQ